MFITELRASECSDPIAAVPRPGSAHGRTSLLRRRRERLPQTLQVLDGGRVPGVKYGVLRAAADVMDPAGGDRFVLAAQSFEPDPRLLADMRGRLVKWASISLEKAAGSNRYKALYEFEEDLLCAVSAALDEKKESAAVRLCARLLALFCSELIR